MKILIILFLCSTSSASRILFLFPTSMKSHMMTVHAVSTLLAERGHNVTVVSPFRLKKQIENHREITTAVSEEEAVDIVNELLTDTHTSLLTMIQKTSETYYKVVEDTIQSVDFQNLLDEQFDLLIIGIGLNRFLLGYGDYFKCPTIVLSTQMHILLTDLLIGNPIDSSIANHNAEPKESTFLWRMKNFFIYGIELAIITYFDYYQKLQYDKLFPPSKYRSYEESIKNISLTLINDHSPSSTPRPIVTNSIEVQGIYLNPIPNQLPKDIQDFLDNADDGAIFFSLGSTLKISTVFQNKSATYLKMFGRLKYKVLLRWDEDEIHAELPANVLIAKWLPQVDILAHPNVKLFISHCGLGGITEAKFHGVPILAIPYYHDQFPNAKKMVSEGWGMELNLETLDEEIFYRSITQMMEDNSFYLKAKKLSRINRDRPMSARDTAIYWIEYVLRYHGAPHLQYQGLKLNFFQRNFLDVITFLMCSGYFAYKAIKNIIKFIYKNILTDIKLKID